MHAKSEANGGEDMLNLPASDLAKILRWTGIISGDNSLQLGGCSQFTHDVLTLFMPLSPSLLLPMYYCTTSHGEIRQNRVRYALIYLWCTSSQIVDLSDSFSKMSKNMCTPPPPILNAKELTDHGLGLVTFSAEEEGCFKLTSLAQPGTCEIYE